MIRVILTAFALLVPVPSDLFAGIGNMVATATATRGDGVAIVGFYVASKGNGYPVGNTWVVIESADGNGFALAEVVIHQVRPGRGVIIAVNLIYSDAEFTAPPTVTIVGQGGSGAEVYAVMGE